jgi:hypothetical protein
METGKLCLLDTTAWGKFFFTKLSRGARHFLQRDYFSTSTNSPFSTLISFTLSGSLS